MLISSHFKFKLRPVVLKLLLRTNRHSSSSTTPTQIPLFSLPKKASTLRGAKSLVPITYQPVHDPDSHEITSIIDQASVSNWSQVLPSIKRDLLLEFAQAIHDHHDRLSLLESRQAGKTLVEARAEVREVVNVIRYFAGWADKLDAGQVLASTTNADGLLRSDLCMYQPHGVVAAIASFNYPLLLAAWKFAPALAAGNTVILKPSEWTPLTCLAVKNLITDARLKSAFQVITGGAETAATILENPKINHVSFTGSTQIGTELVQKYPLRSMNLELGGKNSLYVDASGDLDVALESVLEGGWSNAGQNCCAVSRLILHKDIHTQFLEMLVSALSNRYGCMPLSLYSPNTNMGFIGTHIKTSLFFTISSLQVIDMCGVVYFFDTATVHHAQRIRQYLRQYGSDLTQTFPPADIVDSRDKLPSSANVPEEVCQRWVPPTLYTHVPSKHPLAHSIEIFGPVVCVLDPASSIRHAIDLVNDTDQFGLAAGIIARDQTAIHQFTASVHVGMVWVNMWNLTPVHVPFGGWLKSGRGKELGKEGVLEYMRRKSIVRHDHTPTP